MTRNELDNWVTAYGKAIATGADEDAQIAKSSIVTAFDSLRDSIISAYDLVAGGYYESAKDELEKAME